MCGIAGVIDLDGPSLMDTAPMQAAMDRMAERGPDDAGLFSGPGVLLGHRRLAVIDPNGARQPWLDSGGNAVLVYNGEIYNFPELRRQLESRGHTFRSRSDTEVLMLAWREWGAGCLERLRGMYAFAIWDATAQRVFLARDRVGVKPLFYAVREHRLMFASTLPALLCLPGIEPIINLEAVSHYLTSVRTTLGTQTLYRDVFTLLPGTSLEMRRGQGHAPAPRVYWDFPRLPAVDKAPVAPAAATEELRALVEATVREQLISDVPFGGFLSGGLDSSILAALASDFTGGRFLAYNIGYDEAGFSEWPYVEEVAAACNMECRRLILRSQDYPANWHALVAGKGQPLSTPNEVPIWHLAQAVKQTFTVALTGEGSDEIFGGYVLPYFSALDYDRARHQPPGPGDRLSPLDAALEQLYGRSWFACRTDHYLLLNSWIPVGRKPELLTGDAWAQLHEDDAMFTHYEELFGRFDACTTLDALLQVHARVNLEGLLARVDSSTMAAGVEGRVPFTDHRLAELLFRLPDNCKLDWCSEAAREQGRTLNAAQAQTAGLVDSKILLRQAFAGRIPESIRRRPKMSFPVPFQRGFAGSWRELATTAVTESGLYGTLLAPAAMTALLKHPEHQANAMALWPIVNLCLWQRASGARLG